MSSLRALVTFLSSQYECQFAAGQFAVLALRGFLGCFGEEDLLAGVTAVVVGIRPQLELLPLITARDSRATFSRLAASASESPLPLLPPGDEVFGAAGRFASSWEALGVHADSDSSAAVQA